MYYRNAQAALVVYDLTKASSLIKARHWVAELQRQASPGICIALVGNKVDLVNGEEEASSSNRTSGEDDENEDDDEDGPAAGDDDTVQRKVSTAEAKKFAEEEGLLFFETSAKTGGNVTEVFTAIASAIPESALKGARGAAGAAQGALGTGTRGEEGTGRVQLGRREEQGAKNGCSC